ncbi:hypothetical protein PsorP6_001439 [Peronosclerospora sorghi]|uniref:Uncharacterized protein n=1 Tax=Peronosclerospora sorghi TaxID=230839 RepID=A0ACC0WS15_9STRA|nr:hypothetical protein PsorP6_001439 [Peronosclerospora sorghi]
MNATHNHDAAEELSAYPFARVITEAHSQLVKQSIRSGVAPRAILSTLRECFPDCNTTRRDIYNVKQKMRLETLNGRYPLEAPLDGLVEREITHPLRRDLNGTLTHLFIVPKSAEEIMSKYSANDIFVKDSTYKTTRYNTPLLHGIGVTSTNQTFTMYYCFMRNEKEEEYHAPLCSLRQPSPSVPGYFHDDGSTLRSQVEKTSQHRRKVEARGLRPALVACPANTGTIV